MDAKPIRDRVTRFYSYYMAGRCFSPEGRLALIDAVDEYAFFDKEPDFSAFQESAGLTATFYALKPNLDSSKRSTDGGTKGAAVRHGSTPKLGGQDGGANSPPIIHPYPDNRSRIEVEVEKEVEKQRVKTTSPNGDAVIEKNKIFSTESQERFDRFWEAYPSKIAKGQALKTWKKLKPTEEDVVKMIAALEEAAKSDKRFRDGYIPNPSTWLNGLEWENEYAAAKAQANKTPPDGYKIHAQTGEVVPMAWGAKVGDMYENGEGGYVKYAETR